MPQTSRTKSTIIRGIVFSFVGLFALLVLWLFLSGQGIGPAIPLTLLPDPFPDNPEHHEMPSIPGIPEPPDRPGRPELPGRPERPSRMERPERPEQPTDPNPQPQVQFFDLDPATVRPTIDDSLRKWQDTPAIHAVFTCIRSSKDSQTGLYDRNTFEVWKKSPFLRVDITNYDTGEKLLNLVFPGDSAGYAWVDKTGGWAPIQARTLDEFIAEVDSQDPIPYVFRQLSQLQLLLNGQALVDFPESADEPAEAHRRINRDGSESLHYFHYRTEPSQSLQLGLRYPSGELYGIFFDAPSVRPRRHPAVKRQRGEPRQPIQGSLLHYHIVVASQEYDIPIPVETFIRPETATMRHSDFQELVRSVERHRRRR